MMKSKQEILNRLQKLRSRYLQNFLYESQERKYCNCVFNSVNHPKKFHYKKSEPNLDISPRKTNSVLIVLHDPREVHLCTYGSESGRWSGDLCDEQNDAAPNCKYFKPQVNEETLREQFNILLKDDEFVLKNYPDIAALQWTIEDRVYKHEMTFFSRILYTFAVFLFNRRPSPPFLTEGVSVPKEDLPEDVWDDSKSNNGV